MKHLPTKGGVQRLEFILQKGQWRFVEFRRDGDRLTATLAARDEFASDTVHYYYRTFLPVIVHLLSHSSPAVRHAIADLRDGSQSPSRHLVFSANFPDALLVPDPEFFNSQGYESLRRYVDTQRPWHDRENTIVWRGSTTGRGCIASDGLDPRAMNVRPRIRMCALLKSVPGVDVKLNRIVQSDDPEGDMRCLTSAGLVGGSIAAESWLNRKFAIDIDGNTNAWSNLFTRLLFGCCVIKVGSQYGFRQWYYDRLTPWKTHIPVSADLSDLIEKIEWCRAHPAECAEIAATGQALARSMTQHSETQIAIDRINLVLGSE